MKTFEYHECKCPKCENEIKAVLIEEERFIRPKVGPEIPYVKLAYSCPRCSCLFTTFELREENTKRASKAHQEWRNNHEYL